MVAKRGSLASVVEQSLVAKLVARRVRRRPRLPSELELGESLGVSRTVVREALKRLQRTGLIRTVHGSGRWFLCTSA